MKETVVIVNFGISARLARSVSTPNHDIGGAPCPQTIRVQNGARKRKLAEGPVKASEMGDIQKFKRQSYTAERSLMKFLRGHSIWSWRVPSSGYKTGGYALPDVLGVNPMGDYRVELLGFEVKCTNKDQRTIRLKGNESPILTWLKNGKEFPVPHRGFLVMKFIGRNRWKGMEINEEPHRYRFEREGAVKLPTLAERLEII